MNLAEQPHFRRDSKGKTAGATDGVFIIKRSAPLVIRRFKGPIDIDAGLVAQTVFEPVVVGKHLAVNPLPLTHGATKNAGKKLHTIVSLKLDAAARQICIQKKAVITMVLRSLITVERLVHRVVEGNVVRLSATQSKVHARAYDRQKITLDRRERKSRNGFARSKENVVVVLLGQREVRFNMHRTDAVNQKVARIDRPRLRARRGKPCCNCQKTVTTF